MGHTFAQKVLARNAGLPSVQSGQVIDVFPDLVLSHDNTAAIVRIFREIGVDRVKYPERLAVTLDHAVPAPTTQHAQNHAEIRRFVAQQSIPHFFEVGRGICHQVLCEEGLVQPGHVVLGADSHSTHYGALGAFGAGIGRSEVAAIWATGRIWLRVPESIKITVTGELGEWVSAKDMALHIVGTLGADAGTYASLEFHGPGISALSMESRFVLPNVMAEMGVKNAWIAPDEVTFKYQISNTKSLIPNLKSPIPNLQSQISNLLPDPDARYVAEYTFDASTVEPQIACPHAVDNVVPLSQVAGTRVQQAFLGTCTNGRLEDIAEAARVLSGRRVAPGTRLLVIPASSQVLQDAVRLGYIETLLAAGAIIGTPGCGPCMGNHLGVPAPGEVTISTANRNFRGRMGTRDAEIYLASPAVVAASAVAGEIAHPRDVYQGVRESGNQESKNRGISCAGPIPDSPIPDSPSPDSPSPDSPIPDSPIPRSPNLQGETAMIITGKAWRYGDNVNTDVIFPGKYTYTLTDPEEIVAHALEDLDPSFAAGVQPGDVIVAGRNWGCGSSREQAATCLKWAGVGAVVAVSFARIFYRNAINNGLPAIVCPEAVAVIEAGQRVTIDLGAGEIRCSAGVFAFEPFPLSVQKILTNGGLIPHLQKSLLGL